MLTEQQLRALALDRAQAHLDGILSRKVEVRLERHETAWDPTDLRTVFTADMIVWYPTATFEVLLDEGNQPLGFVDEDKWKDCEWVPLPRERLLELIVGTGFVTASAAIADVRKGERDCAEVVVTADATRADATRLLARVNPASERVISIMPMSLES